MSGDPKRWLEAGGGATNLERELLNSDDVEPPRAAHGAVWAALVTRLPPLGGPPGGTSPPPGAGPPPIGAAGGGALGAGAAKTVVGAMALKVGAAIAIAGVVAGTATFALRSNETPSASSQPTAIPAPAVASVAEGPSAPAVASSLPTQSSATAAEPPPPTVASAVAAVDEPAKGATEEGRPARPVALRAKAVARATPTSNPKLSALSRESHSAAAASETTAAPTLAPPSDLGLRPNDPQQKSDALREENALLATARAAIRRGDARSALASLEQARSRFPNGALVQEREVLTIEALSQSGDLDGASARATRFLKAFSSSPHSAHVRTFVR